MMEKPLKNPVTQPLELRAVAIRLAVLLLVLALARHVQVRHSVLETTLYTKKVEIKITKSIESETIVCEL